MKKIIDDCLRVGKRLYEMSPEEFKELQKTQIKKGWEVYKKMYHIKDYDKSNLSLIIETTISDVYSVMDNRITNSGRVPMSALKDSLEIVYKADAGSYDGLIKTFEYFSVFFLLTNYEYAFENGIGFLLTGRSSFDIKEGLFGKPYKIEIKADEALPFVKEWNKIMAEV